MEKKKLWKLWSFVGGVALLTAAVLIPVVSVRTSEPEAVAVSVTEAVAVSETAGIDREDGEYVIDVTLTGGSGRATIASPAVLLVKEGAAYARIQWSSSNYDYMKVGDKTYRPINKEGNSMFEIPVPALDEEIEVIANTTAMSTPHEITYTLTFHSDSTEKPAALPPACGKSQNSHIPAVDQSISPSLAYESRMKLDYAEQFAVDYYDGGYALITISDGSRFLVVPPEMAVPEKMDEDIVAVRQPVGNIYLVASAVMDMFCSLDALDAVSLSGTKEENWFIEEAKEAMAAGRIAYAGKYNMPDYEKIVESGCELAIESTMIFHSPDVKEKMEKFGIPVLVDHSSYEEHPLGRTEWVKLYGILLGKEKEAIQAFETQKTALEQAVSETQTGKTVAFFYITSNEMVNVRKAGDYIPQMIELAGGTYIFAVLGEDGKASSTVNMQMEEFYAKAKDADYLIYNSTIDGGVHSIEELLGKSGLLADFKAVKEGNVYCTTQNLYQDSMKLGTVTQDIHTMLMMEKNTDAKLNYLFRLE